MSNVPLCVDLDGTFILCDSLIASLLRGMRERRVVLLRIPIWLLKGRAGLKQNLSGHVLPDFAALPVNQALLDYLRVQKNAGRPLLLVTGADFRIARGVSDYFPGLFDEVLASDGRVNLTGGNKARLLTGRFGLRGFDYAGNEFKDLAIWSVARRAIVVSSSDALARKAAQVCEVEKSFIVPAPVR